MGYVYMNFKIKNKGISYIEFILVVSIIFLLTGFAAITMSVVNKNNVTKAADKIATGMNQCKILSLSKGSNKGSITFAQNKGKCYYYFGSNEDKKYYVCSSPCSMKVIIKGNTYNITNNTRVRIKISNSTGAFLGAHLSLDGGESYSQLVYGTADLTGVNRIEVSNKQGKTCKIDFNIQTGTVKVTY